MKINQFKKVLIKLKWKNKRAMTNYDESEEEERKQRVVLPEKAKRYLLLTDLFCFLTINHFYLISIDQKK